MSKISPLFWEPFTFNSKQLRDVVIFNESWSRIAPSCNELIALCIPTITKTCISLTESFNVFSKDSLRASAEVCLWFFSFGFRQKIRKLVFVSLKRFAEISYSDPALHWIEQKNFGTKKIYWNGTTTRFMFVYCTFVWLWSMTQIWTYFWLFYLQNKLKKYQRFFIYQKKKNVGRDRVKLEKWSDLPPSKSRVGLKSCGSMCKRISMNGTKTTLSGVRCGLFMDLLLPFPHSNITRSLSYHTADAIPNTTKSRSSGKPPKWSH